MLRRLSALAIVLLSAAPLLAQEPEAPPPPPPDVVDLTNGDRITGTVTSLAGGVLKVSTPNGDLEIPTDDIANLTTGVPLTVVNNAGETYEQRITGFANGELQLAAPAAGQPALPSIALADVDEIHPPKEPVRWSGSLQLGANLATGNTDRRGVAGSAEAIRRTDDDRWHGKVAGAYSDEFQATGVRTLTARWLQGSLQYDYFLSEPLYLLANSTARTDTLADLKLRLDAGLGVGYQWVDADTFSLSTEAGVSYVEQEFFTAGLAKKNTVVARVAYGLDWDITGDLEFLQDANFQPSLESSDDIYLTVDSRLRLSLTEKMFTQVQWLLFYDNQPSPGLDRVDNQYLITVGWSF